MSISNNVDVITPLNQTEQAIANDADENHAQTQGIVNQQHIQTRNHVTERVAFALAELLPKIADIVNNVDTNAQILNGLSTVNGAIDGTASAVNTNTNAKAQEIIDAVESIDFTVLQDQLTAGFVDINTNLDADNTAILNALSEVGAGSLRELIDSKASTAALNAASAGLSGDISTLDTALTTAINDAVSAINDNTDNERNAVIDELRSTETDSLFNLFRTELLRTTNGSLRAATQASLDNLSFIINNNINEESATIVNEIRNTGVGSLYALLVTAINASRDFVSDNVEAARSAVFGEIRRTGTGSLYDNIIAELRRTNNGSIIGAINAAMTAIIQNTDNERNAIIAAVNSRATAATVTSAASGINANVDAEAVSIRTAITDARNSVNGNIDTEANSIRSAITNQYLSPVRQRTSIPVIPPGGTHNITIPFTVVNKAFMRYRLARSSNTTGIGVEALDAQIINTTTVRVTNNNTVASSSPCVLEMEIQRRA